MGAVQKVVAETLECINCARVARESTERAEDVAVAADATEQLMDPIQRLINLGLALTSYDAVLSARSVAKQCIACKEPTIACGEWSLLGMVLAAGQLVYCSALALFNCWSMLGLGTRGGTDRRAGACNGRNDAAVAHAGYVSP